MWVINNNSPFAVDRSWVRDKSGAEVWLVAIKAVFDIKPDGSLHLAEEQEPVNIAPKLREDVENASLLYDTDLPHKKNSTDVLVDGYAYAPYGQLATTFDVSLRVANISKTLRVTGDRIWQKSLGRLSVSQPQPFTKMPLIYERAFGGMDQISDNPKHRGWEQRNPVGCGFAMKADHLDGKPAANIEYPTMLINQWKQRPTPAGFGPIAGHWSPRVESAGTYDENWEKNKQPLLPDDFDENYFQCAPQDQQVPGFLKGGELVELSNMTPNGFLRFRLPRVTFGLSTDFDDGTSVSHRAVLHTVTVKPDYPKVVLVWHLHHECHHKVLKLSSTTLRLKKRILQRDHGNMNGAWSTL